MSDPELHPAVPDDYDRASDQGMWTGEAAALGGKYPKTEPAADTTSKAAGRRQIPVHGATQKEIADDSVKATDINDRIVEESELRKSVTEDELAQSRAALESAKRVLGYKKD